MANTTRASRQESGEESFKLVPIVSLRVSQARKALTCISESYTKAGTSSDEVALWDEFKQEFDVFMVNLHRKFSGSQTLLRDFMISHYVFLKSDRATTVQKQTELGKFIEELLRSIKAANQEAERRKLGNYIISLRQLTAERKGNQINFFEATVLILLYQVAQLLARPYLAVGLPMFDLICWLKNEQISLQQQQAAREDLRIREQSLICVENLFSVLKKCEPETLLTAFLEILKKLDVALTELINDGNTIVFNEQLDAAEQQANSLMEILQSLQSAVS